MKQIRVHKDRTTIVQVSIGFDGSQDTFTSEIRIEKDRTSDLIATWEVSFVTDGTDGELLLTLDDSITSGITKTTGYMDIKRVSNGEPISLFDEILEVLFVDSITS